MKTNVEQGILIAAGATAVASVMLATSAWRAVDIADADPQPPAVAGAEGPAEELPVFRGLAPEAVRLVAENEPFRAEREPAPVAYRMPGERRVEPRIRVEPPPPDPPEFTVIGTVTTADGGIAVIQTDAGLPPVFARLDQRVDGYRIAAVTGDGAALERDGRVFDLAVADPEAIPQRRDDDDDDRRRNRRRRSQRDEQAARQTAIEQAARIRGLVEEVGQAGPVVIQGLPPELQEMADEALQRFMGGDTPQRVDIGQDGNRMIIRRAAPADRQ